MMNFIRFDMNIFIIFFVLQLAAGKKKDKKLKMKPLYGSYISMLCDLS